MKYGRELLKNVQGYVPGEQPAEGPVIKLNTNENPYPPSPRVMEALQRLAPEALRRYPDPAATGLRDACAAYYGYDDRDWIVAGNGMDELLALVLRAFVDPGDTVLTTYPTYTLYEVLCNLHGASIRHIDLDENYQLPEAFFRAPARLCFLSRPNAPSGVAAPRADVERLCREFSGLVVIDEAYAEFAHDHCMDLPKYFENAIVMRSFSKSFSLAGMRLGTAVARPEIIREFMKVKDSYNLSAVAQVAGAAAVGDLKYMQGNVRKIQESRARLREALLELGFSAPESQSNFLLAQRTEEPPARAVFEALRERGILVRHFAARGLDDCLRISVGTEGECKALLEALRAILQ